MIESNVMVIARHVAITTLTGSRGRRLPGTANRCARRKLVRNAFSSTSWVSSAERPRAVAMPSSPAYVKAYHDDKLGWSPSRRSSVVRTPGRGEVKMLRGNTSPARRY